MRLSPKQWDYVLGSTAFINIADGPVRSGKTFACLTRFAEFCVSGPPGDLMVLGKTERTIRRNVIGPMKGMFGAQRVRYVQGAGELRFAGRTIYVVGVNDVRAEEKIRGATLAGAYCNELTLFPESAFNQLVDRCSVPGAKIFGDTNPDSPFHWLMKHYLSRADGRDVARWRFRLEDNPVLSPEYVERLKRLHVGMWYRRMVLGEWVAAEGAVYDMFDPARHVVDTLPAMRNYWVGIDYGTTNPTVAVLLGLGDDERLYVVREWRWDSAAKGRRLTDAQLSAEYRRWIGTITPLRVFVDPSAASFITQLYHDGVKGITEADNAVIDGIQDVSTLLATDRLRIHSSCTGLIEEMSNYTWDPKAQERGEDKPLKQNDHGCDALRYVCRGVKKVWFRWVVGAKGAAA